jgi:predicted RNase H-like HicB family nuclease
MRQFVALVSRDPNGGFLATFPDLPGCVVSVAALEDVPHVAIAALSERLDAMQVRGEPIPEPSAAANLKSHPDHVGAIALPIPVGDDDPLFHAASNDEWPDAEA